MGKFVKNRRKVLKMQINYDIINYVECYLAVVVDKISRHRHIL